MSPWPGAGRLGSADKQPGDVPTSGNAVECFLEMRAGQKRHCSGTFMVLTDQVITASCLSVLFTLRRVEFQMPTPCCLLQVSGGMLVRVIFEAAPLKTFASLCVRFDAAGRREAGGAF